LGTDRTLPGAAETAFIDGVAVSKVPELVTLSLLGAGLAGAAGTRRRSKAKQA